MMQPTHTQQKLKYPLFILGVFLLLFALGTGEEPRGDAGARLLVTRQILTDGRLHLSAPHPEWWLIETPYGWTSYFGIGQILLFVPFEIAGKAFSLLPPKGFAVGMRRDFPTTYLYCPLVGVAYFLALLSLLETLGLSARAAAAASLLFTFSSLTAHYVAQSFQEEAIASVFICLSLRAALLWQRAPQKRYAFAMGVLAASVLLFRFNAIFALIPITVIFAHGLFTIGLGSLRARQSIGAALLGASGPAAVHLLFAYLRFGSLFSTGYDQVVLWQPFRLEVLSDLLFGFGKGLFIFSPLLGIALWGMWIDRARSALYGIACLVALAGSVTLSASYFAPDGCWSWGMRYQVHLLPLFAYHAWVGMRDLFARRIGMPIVGIAVGLGLFVQFCSLLAPDRLEYSQVPNPRPDGKLDTLHGCQVVQEHQFAMRLTNIATVIRAVREGSEITDWNLRTKFGILWALLLAQGRSAWVRGVVILDWLGILIAAAICLYHALKAPH